jgi:hypothetical protein
MYYKGFETSLKTLHHSVSFGIQPSIFTGPVTQETLITYNYHTSSLVIYVLVIFTDAEVKDVPVFWDTTPCKLVYR